MREMTVDVGTWYKLQPDPRSQQLLSVRLSNAFRGRKKIDICCKWGNPHFSLSWISPSLIVVFFGFSEKIFPGEPQWETLSGTHYTTEPSLFKHSLARSNTHKVVLPRNQTPTATATRCFAPTHSSCSSPPWRPSHRLTPRPQRGAVRWTTSARRGTSLL